MKSSEPPAFATWLLKYLCSGQYSDALASDLVDVLVLEASVGRSR